MPKSETAKAATKLAPKKGRTGDVSRNVEKHRVGQQRTNKQEEDLETLMNIS